MAAAASSEWDRSVTEPCVPAPEEIHPQPQQQPQPQGAAAAAGPAPQANTAAGASSMPAAASASAVAAPQPVAPCVPREPLDRSVPGPPLSCTSFTYAAGGDAAAQEYFLCTKSDKPLYDPVQCANGHYTCRGCLAQLNGVCPVCRDSSNVQADVGVGVKGILNGLRVLCADCGEEVTRDRLTHHRNNLCQLPCIRGCGATATRTGAEAHEAVCPLLPAICATAEFGCAWNGVRRDEAAHTAACSFHAVLPALRMMQGTHVQLFALIAQLEAEKAVHKAAIAALQRQVADHVKPLHWHTDGDAWFAQHGLSLGGGWVSSARYPFRIAKDGHGTVHLSGVITGGQFKQTIVTLPEGYRPAKTIRMSANGPTISQSGFVITTEGAIVVYDSWGFFVSGRGCMSASFGGCDFSTV